MKFEAVIHPSIGTAVLGLETLLIWWAIAQVEPAVSSKVKDIPHEARTIQPLTTPRWVVWYGNNDQIHRQQVDSGAYRELRQSLHQARAQDQERLVALAANYLSIDLQPVFAEIVGRREPFLISMFDFGSSSAILGAALSAAETAQRSPNQEEALDQVRAAAATKMVDRYRDQLIAPETTLRSLRDAAGRSLELLRQDLLQNCDRYDRAFRGLVSSFPTTIETLDPAAGWQMDVALRQETVTFRSLCTGLREVDLGVYVVETVLREALTATDAVIYQEGLEIVVPIAQTALEIAKYIEANTDTFSEEWGLSREWARTPAKITSYISYVRILARRVGERLDVRRKRPRLRLTIQKKLDQLQGELMEHLKTTCNEFIATELDRIELGLAARGEGFWSKP